MPKFRRRPIVVEANQWHKNGDHPDDYSNDDYGYDGAIGEPRTFPASERKAKGWEGEVVRYYRHPVVPGEHLCPTCGFRMHEHGWIDAGEGGHTVCPGDWIITVEGMHRPCPQSVFAQDYEPVGAGEGEG